MLTIREAEYELEKGVKTERKIMLLNYCTQCGKKLISRTVGDEGMQKYCSVCNKFYFDNPANVVLVTITNEKKQIFLLRQKYISENKWMLCSGYVRKGETLEETVIREVFEETGQVVKTCEYICSYYFGSKNLIMSGFIARVNTSEFSVSNEVDALKWCEVEDAVQLIERDNNYLGIHLDNCLLKIKTSERGME